MAEVKIYHNPRCRKSREALELLENTCKDLQIVDYLKNPPSEKELEELVKMLGIPAGDLLRKGENIYKEKYKGKSLTEKEWIKAMVQNPILIERPIVVNGKKAVVARPAEKVNQVL